MRRLSIALLAALGAAALTLLAAPAAIPADPGAPSCAEGPQRVGDVVEGTPCADTIVVPPGVAAVQAGGGDDTIFAPVAAAIPCEAVCLSVGSQTFEGGPGDDVVFGERGNDILRGNEGNDRLYGGIGDDRVEGGPGNDLVSGGFGADTIDGQAGDDYVRGDGTIDHIHDTGGGIDTLSYASGVTPGFGGGIDTGASGFPGGENGERGVHLNLGSGGLNGNNGIAAEGGGFDEVEPGVFEVVVGTPFPDYLVGGEAGETIYGGGGADVIRGNGGDDNLLGGADGDLLDGGEGNDAADGGAGSDNCIGATGASCEGSASSVATRDAGKASVGLMVPGAGISQLYVAGSSGDDTLSASYGAGSVTLALSGGSFDTAAGAASGCTVAASSASCPVGLLDSIVLAGLGGGDQLTAAGFPQSTAVVLLGGEGDDALTGDEGSEDALVDGRGGGADVLSALGRDDVLLHQGGPDTLLGGDGNDLFLSTSICDGEGIDGGEGRDNASWTRLLGDGVEVRLDAAPIAQVGRYGAAGDPGCGGEPLDTLFSIEDLEGSEQPDLFVGDAGPNQLLGHGGPDEYLAGAGPDVILANSGDSDPLIDCGADSDTAVIDIPTVDYVDADPIACELVRRGAVEEFRAPTLEPPSPQPPTQPLPQPSAPAVQPQPQAPPPPPVDRVAPRTKLGHRPPKLLKTTKRHLRVSFRFASSEAGSRFRCRLDRRPYCLCSSPRTYNVGRGRHVVRIVAVDAAGNADPTPALFRFRLLRRG